MSGSCDGCGGVGGQCFCNEIPAEEMKKWRAVDTRPLFDYLSRNYHIELTETELQDLITMVKKLESEGE